MPRSLAASRLVLLIAIVLVVAGCGGEAPSESLPGGALPFLSGTSWIVVSVNDRAPIAGAVPTVVFAASRVSGFAGCNQFGGSYQFDAPSGRFAVRDLGATAMGCLQAASPTSSPPSSRRLERRRSRASTPPAGSS